MLPQKRFFASALRLAFSFLLVHPLVSISTMAIRKDEVGETKRTLRRFSLLRNSLNIATSALIATTLLPVPGPPAIMTQCLSLTGVVRTASITVS